MKRINFIIPILLVIFFSSCVDTYTEIYKANSPIYMSYDELRSSVKATAPVPLKTPGKIYFKDNHLFIVERLKGIHVYDMKSPKNPVNVGFITVPGCVDIAIRNNVLYADSYVDLVVMDISDVKNIKEVNRVKDALPYTVPPIDNDYRYDKVDKEKGVVVKWEVKTVKNELEMQPTPIYPIGRYYDYSRYENLTKSFDGGAGYANTGSSSTSATTFGKGGSMVCFGLYDDYLYILDRSSVFTFNVEKEKEPTAIGSQGLGWNVETMFIYDNHMFVGTMDGLIICSLENPISPKEICRYRHVTSCDPVVVEDGFAYVTLRSGVSCRGVNEKINKMDVLKLSTNYKYVSLIASYDTFNPHGLGIDSNTLFLCDGAEGLKIYDCNDKTNITNNLIKKFPNIQAYDVIPLAYAKQLFMIGDDGFYLYDYSDLNNITLLSKIEVKQ